MKPKYIRRRWGLSTIAGMLISAFIAINPASAKIPEPDHIIYGHVMINGVIQDTGKVTIKINGSTTPLLSYTIGENPQAGDYYVLRIPMDALTPRTPDTCVPGDSATIHINDLLAASTVIGEKGTITLMDINTGDTDGDNLPDSWEMDKFKDLSHDGTADTDKDGLNDRAEYEHNTDPNQYDTDHDGFSDGIELAMGLNPLTHTANEESMLLQQTVLVIQMASGETLPKALNVPDINNNGTIGIPEALYLLQGLSGGRK